MKFCGDARPPLCAANCREVVAFGAAIIGGGESDFVKGAAAALFKDRIQRISAASAELELIAL